MDLLSYSALFTFTIIGCQSETYVFDDTSGLGRHFDGIGGLSGGGATSKLLINYKEPYRSQILDYLFKPNFGASLQILKVEIGGDAQSTDGTEASHMHNPWDENYNRGYEWWLMKEAKKRNPNIKLYGLPWGFPGWLAGRPNDPYVNRQNLATYITKWIEGAKIYHNLTIDLIGIWNEHNYDVEYIKLLRQTLDKYGFKKVRIVAADGNDVGIADDILKDKHLADVVDFIGVHYPGTQSKPDALKTDKQLWASEDYSTFNDDVGGGCWARTLNQNYVNGKMTSTVAWNLIASYYNYLIWFRTGLMTAVEPWSGNYAVESPIWVTAHTTQFTDIGWTYLKHGEGVGHFKSGGSYVSLVSPDKKDLTIVIETMTHNHSVCVRPPLPPFEVQPAQITLELQGSFANIESLQVWYTKPSFASALRPVYFERKESVKPQSGKITLDLGIDEIWTLTTLTRGQKGTYPTPPSSKPFPLPYKDDFEGYDVNTEPYNLAQQMGSFEVLSEVNNKFLRQVVLQQPLPWCYTDWEHNLNRTLTLIGDHSWGNISISVDARLSPENGTRGILLAAWVETAGCHAGDINGTFFYVFPEDNFYILSRDFDRKEVISSGSLDNRATLGWNTYRLNIWNRLMFGSVNGQPVMHALADIHTRTGFVGIGTDSWGLADFDNLEIKQGSIP